jgi:hypothetical protein
MRPPTIFVSSGCSRLVSARSRRAGAEGGAQPTRSCLHRQDGDRGAVYFSFTTFSGCTINFAEATFSGIVDFNFATFSDRMVSFFDATLPGGTVDFSGAAFSGSTVDFILATFSGSAVELGAPREWSVPPVGVDGSERGVSWPSPEYLAEIIE